MSTALPAPPLAPFVAFVLRVLEILAPHDGRARLLPTAEAIAAVTDDRAEAALLAVVDLHETEFGLCMDRHGLPCPRWGLVTPRTRRRLATRPLPEHVAQARDSLRIGARLCQSRWALHWFHTGECPCLLRRCPRPLRPTRFSEMENAHWRKVLRQTRAWVVGGPVLPWPLPPDPPPPSFVPPEGLDPGPPSALPLGETLP